MAFVRQRGSRLVGRSRGQRGASATTCGARGDVEARHGPPEQAEAETAAQNDGQAEGSLRARERRRLRHGYAFLPWTVRRLHQPGRHGRGCGLGTSSSGKSTSYFGKPWFLKRECRSSSHDSCHDSWAPENGVAELRRSFRWVLFCSPARRSRPRFPSAAPKTDSPARPHERLSLDAMHPNRRAQVPAPAGRSRVLRPENRPSGRDAIRCSGGRRWIGPSRRRRRRDPGVQAARPTG